MAMKRFHTLSTIDGSLIRLEIYSTSTPSGTRVRNGDAFEVLVLPPGGYHHSIPDSTSSWECLQGSG